MPQTRLPYPAEFRQQRIERVQAGQTPAPLSQELGCCAQTILKWLAQAAIDKSKPLGKGGLTSAEREELSRWRRQVRPLPMEHDILAKATAWFAVKGEKTFTRSSSL